MASPPGEDASSSKRDHLTPHWQVALNESRTMIVFILAVAALATVGEYPPPVQALRTGAPPLACVNLRPLHGLHRPKPASASQFYLTQSSFTYGPGDNITVEIETGSSERYFRGFLVQAYDPSSGSPFGYFLSDQDTKPVTGCSAATHRNNLNKKTVTLTWQPTPPPVVAHSASGERTGGGWSEAGNTLASQWLGINRHGSSARSFSSQLFDTGVSKRQLPSYDQDHQKPPPPSSRSVRFRATIVVTYEEFYMGYESTDQKFDKFDYAPTSKPPPASTQTATAPPPASQ